LVQHKTHIKKKFNLPELAHDESTSRDTNKETKDGKSSSTVDKTGHGSWDRGSTEDNGEKNTRTIFVASRSKDETHKDCSTNSNNRRSPDFLLGNLEGILDLRKERSNGKPDEESNEETPPRAVEGSHVWAGKAAKLDLRGLVILIWVDIDGIGLVFLDLLRLLRKRGNCVRLVCAQ